MPLISALERQRQVKLWEFKASLVYKTSSRTARALTQENPVMVKDNDDKYMNKKWTGKFLVNFLHLFKTNPV
jgi:hypothetical protein